MKKIAFLLIVLSLFVSACGQFEKPTATYKDYSITRIATDGLEVSFYFDVTNPNPIDLDVANYSYNIFINDRKILEQTASGFTLTANKTKQIALPVFIRYSEVFGAAVSLIESLLKGEQYMDYKVEGEIHVGTMGLTVGTPLKAEGKIKIPQQ